ncbi:hypothetical protein HYW67_00680 [Candidatus Parcubacteria bacterium]|nr:hypothetical protein [Candidatus Parcubacteria bacterium]
MTQCKACSAKWEFARDLQGPAKERGAPLIFVSIWARDFEVQVQRPERRDISQAGFIERVLLETVALRYQLRLVFAVGQQGFQLGGDWAGEPAAFCAPFGHRIGLRVLCSPRPASLASGTILDWYAEVLRHLCEREVEVNGVKYGRGPILKIALDDPNGESKARILLHVALLQAGESPRFVREVFKQMDVNRLAADARASKRVRAIR